MNRRLLIAVLGLATAVLLASCAPAHRVTYIPEGGSYTVDDLARLLDEADLGAAVRIDTSDAVDERQSTLADLRREGDDTGRLADTLTLDFPADLAAVPVLVEHATYEGAEAWVVIEAWGEEGGSLTHRQLWVLSYDDGAVLAALRKD